MFKGVHDSRKVAKKNSVMLSQLSPEFTPILNFEQLLSVNPRRQEILNNIKSLINLPTINYETYYRGAINHFSEFVQQLPETSFSYYSHPGGLLDHGLERASLALSLCHAYLFPNNSQTDNSPLHEVWLYAIFTASLLMDIGKIATKQIITLLDNKGNELTKWQPSTGTMVNKAKYYKYEFRQENLDRLKTFYTPLLAQQLLSRFGLKIKTLNAYYTGFDWIASQPEILEAWLALLNEDFSGGGHILTIIPLAQAQTIAHYFNEFNKDFSPQENNHEKQKPEEKIVTSLTTDLPEKSTNQNHNASTKSFFQPTQVSGTSGFTIATAATSAYIAGTIATTISPTLTMGEAFLNWLKTKIQSQSWANNPNASIQRLKEGFFININLIQEFCRQNPNYGNWRTLYKQFMQLDLALNNSKIQTYYNPNATYNKLQQGIIMNPYLFLNNQELNKIPMNNNFHLIVPKIIETGSLKMEVSTKPISSVKTKT